MSEIRVTTVSDTAGTGPVTLTKQSAPKAWVNFNSVSTTSIRGSFSVSSVTDTATGNTTVTISSAMSSADSYATVGNAGNGTTNPGNAFTSSNPITSTTGHHETMNDEATNSDRGHNSLIFFGDLA